MWGTSWRQRLRLLPLDAALALGDRLAALAPAARVPTTGAWRPGITVLVPDRDAPEMLAEALASLREALARCDEPAQVIVVANGAPLAAYDDVRARFPEVEWVHDERPLGFAGAVERGLAQARHDATFLMNNDMTLDAAALATLLPHRAPDVFAIGSQILQQDATGRREETGFTDWYADASGVHLYHAPPPDADGAVPHLCASGGAALFRTATLRGYVADSRAYDPFYWEDVEWSLRAWRDGYRVLFCPRSLARHRHRATTARYYAAHELTRIVERNRLLFDARHGVTDFGRDWLMTRICDLAYASQRELAQPRQAAGVLQQRRMRRTEPSHPPVLTHPSGKTVVLRESSYSFRMRLPGSSGRPRVLFVTPFATFPPRHGGARRVAELVRGLRKSFDVALVTDEADLYGAHSFADFDGLAAVYLVRRGAGESTPESGTLAGRMRTHCHPALVDAVARACREFQPALVQVEHAELAPLVAQRDSGAKWLLDLHDAYGPDDFDRPAEAAAFAGHVDRYDSVIVCSREDGQLVDHPRVECIGNGARIETSTYRPSATHGLLFIGPFRYGPNHDGILAFLRTAWPAIRAAVPDATLLILGGDEHAERTLHEPAFAQPGVTVSGHRDDVPHLLSQCALTINPLAGIRGSAVKLVESLAAGRACVSTSAGARGFLADAPPGLVTVPDVPSMAPPVIELLTDAAARHRIEDPSPGAFDRYRWSQRIAELERLYRALLREGTARKPDR
jgi:GT2 family glycosyltransferase/glycosyltransferase involved in cell wall biosynthesis